MPQSRIRRYLRHGTLPQLAVFEASARHASLTRAGEELHLAQPTVSTQIRKLSETLGAPLFASAGRNIRLTEAGRRTYEHCQEIFAVLGRMHDALADLRETSARELRIAAPSSAARLVTRLLAGFVRDHPEVAIGVSVGNRAQLLDRLARRVDDLYLLATPPDDLCLVRQRVVANPLVVIAARGDPLCHERAIALSRLARAPFVIREPGSGTRAAVIDLFAGAGLVPRTALEVDSDDGVRSAVAQGVGVGVAARDTFDAARESVAVLDVAGFPIARTWHFAYPVGVTPSVAATEFLRHARRDGTQRVASISHDHSYPEQREA